MYRKKDLIFYLFFLSLLTFYLFRNPGHNGDMPFYIACAIEMEHGESDQAILQTQKVLVEELPANEFPDHVERIGKVNSAYLDFYRVKPLYIFLIVIFHRAGFSYVEASVLPSLISYFFIGLVIAGFAFKKMNRIRAYSIAVISMCIFPTLVLARLSTPDGLSCLFLLTAFLLIITEGRKIYWMSFFLLALFTRVDNIVGELCILVSLIFWPDKKFKNRITLAAFSVLAIFLVSVALIVNWLRTLHFLNVKDHFSVRTMGWANDVGRYMISLPGSFMVFLLILFVYMGFRDGYSWKKESNYIFYTICSIVFIRFLLYPFYEERYLTPYFLFALFAFAFYDRQRISKSW